jgi:hypothetical protein
MSHSFEKILKRQLAVLKKEHPEKGSIWKHYKGGNYIVQSIAMQESDETPSVLYSSFQNPLPLNWHRPLSEWYEMVHSDGKLVQRFTLFTS